MVEFARVGLRSCLRLCSRLFIRIDLELCPKCQTRSRFHVRAIKVSVFMTHFRRLMVILRAQPSRARLAFRENKQKNCKRPRLFGVKLMAFPLSLLLFR